MLPLHSVGGEGSHTDPLQKERLSLLSDVEGEGAVNYAAERCWL